MKKLFIGLLVFGSFSTFSGFSSFAKNVIVDQTCEIAIPSATSLFMKYTINDPVLNVLVHKGYRPFRVDTIPAEGLFLGWGFRNSKYIYASVNRISNGKNFILGSADMLSKSKAYDKLFKRLPSCVLK